MSYFHSLPAAGLDYTVEVSDADAIRIVMMLMGADGSVHNGSSFAVTADTQEGRKRIWLSPTSRHRFEKWAANQREERLEGRKRERERRRDEQGHQNPDH